MPPTPPPVYTPPARGIADLPLDGALELGTFTGGSLIVGSAVRTDLLGAGGPRNWPAPSTDTNRDHAASFQFGQIAGHMPKHTVLKR